LTSVGWSDGADLAAELALAGVDVAIVDQGVHLPSFFARKGTFTPASSG